MKSFFCSNKSIEFDTKKDKEVYTVQSVLEIHLSKQIDNLKNTFIYLSFVQNITYTRTKVIHKNISQGCHKIKKSKIKLATQSLIASFDTFRFQTKNIWN